MSVASQRRALLKRERLIADIEHLYPPDSSGDEGRDLLIDALCVTWRELPLAVLRELHKRNMARENSQ